MPLGEERHMSALRDSQPSPREIEAQLERQAGLALIVEQEGNRLIVSGRVDTSGEREAALDIVTAMAAGRKIDDNLELDENEPDFVGETLANPIVNISDYTVVDESTVGEVDADFSDQAILTDPVAAPGPSDSDEDPVGDGDVVYVPPTDPVVGMSETGHLEVLNGFGIDSAEVEVEPSALDNQPGDEALAEAVLRELREDAATTDLHLHVIVRNGVAHLRGVVEGIEDAENAEAVAGRVPGIVEVMEETTVAGL
jgi:osmotically-inducible protein OsmY